jgi:hypothetical protein
MHVTVLDRALRSSPGTFIVNYVYFRDLATMFLAFRARNIHSERNTTRQRLAVHFIYLLNPSTHFDIIRYGQVTPGGVSII